MVARGHSVLILTLLGLLNPDLLTASSREVTIPQAPVPATSSAPSPADQVKTELAELGSTIKHQLETKAEDLTDGTTSKGEDADTKSVSKASPKAGEPGFIGPVAPATPTADPTSPPVAAPAVGKSSVPTPSPSQPGGSPEATAANTVAATSTPAKVESTTASKAEAKTSTATPAKTRTTSAAKVTLTTLDKTYKRLSPGQMGAEAKAQVQTLAEAHQPTTSGRDGLPIDWLPRETRKALDSPGPRDVVLIGTTAKTAWYVWAETDAVWVGRVDLAKLDQIEAGPIPADQPWQIPGDEVLHRDADGVLHVEDSQGVEVPLVSRRDPAKVAAPTAP